MLFSEKSNEFLRIRMFTSFIISAHLENRSNAPSLETEISDGIKAKGWTKSRKLKSHTNPVLSKILKKLRNLFGGHYLTTYSH